MFAHSLSSVTKVTGVTTTGGLVLRSFVTPPTEPTSRYLPTLPDPIRKPRAHDAMQKSSCCLMACSRYLAATRSRVPFHASNGRKIGPSAAIMQHRTLRLLRARKGGQHFWAVNFVMSLAFGVNVATISLTGCEGGHTRLRIKPKRFVTICCRPPI